MADNINIAESGSNPVATDEIDGVHYQKIKLFSYEDESSSPFGTNACPFVVSGSVHQLGDWNIANIQNNVSASISGGSIALLDGANAIGDIANVRNQISASISGGSLALLAGANTIGAASAIQSGSWNVSNVYNKISASVSGGSVALLSGANAIGDIVNIQNKVSASVSGGSVAILAGANVIGSASAVQSGSWNISNIYGQTSTSISGGSIALLAGTNQIGSASVVQATGSLLRVEPVGSVAHDSVDTGSPIKIGAVAVIPERAAVSASLDRVDFVADRAGRQITYPYSSPESIFSASTTLITDTTRTLLIAGVANVKYYLTHIMITNSGCPVQATIESGNVGKYTGIAGGSGGGYVAALTLPLPMTTGCAINCSCSPTGGSVIAQVVGYKGII